jgi:hypothetical protein
MAVEASRAAVFQQVEWVELQLLCTFQKSKIRQKYLTVNQESKAIEQGKKTLYIPP